MGNLWWRFGVSGFSLLVSGGLDGAAYISLSAMGDATVKGKAVILPVHFRHAVDTITPVSSLKLDL